MEDKYVESGRVLSTDSSKYECECKSAGVQHYVTVRAQLSLTVHGVWRCGSSHSQA